MPYTVETTLSDNIKKFNELEANGFKEMNLYEGELVKHCIDTSKKEHYQPGWAVTNFGRVWSLSLNWWLNPRNQNGYWRIANVYVHRLVNQYFITEEDERTMKIINEHNKRQEEVIKWHPDVHHKTAVKKMNSSQMTKEERVDACMEVNKKKDLIVQIHETDHKDDHRITKGKKTLGEENGTECFDTLTSIIRNSQPETYITYSEDGKRLINMNLKLRGTTPEEEEELNKRFPQFRY